MFLPRTLTTPLPRKIGVANGWPVTVSTIRNQIAIAVAPMKPVITPSRRKLCGRSAIGSSDLVRFHSFGENTQRPGIFQGDRIFRVLDWHRSRHLSLSSASSEIDVNSFNG